MKETFQDDDAWDKAYTSVLTFCDHKQKEIDKQFGDVVDDVAILSKLLGDAMGAT